MCLWTWPQTGTCLRCLRSACLPRSGGDPDLTGWPANSVLGHPGRRYDFFLTWWLSTFVWLCVGCISKEISVQNATHCDASDRSLWDLHLPLPRSWPHLSALKKVWTDSWGAQPPSLIWRIWMSKLCGKEKTLHTYWSPHFPLSHSQSTWPCGLPLYVYSCSQV